METNSVIKKNEQEELEKSQPIPFGGLKLLVTAIVLCGIAGAVGDVLGFIGYLSVQYTSAPSILLLCLALLVIVPVSTLTIMNIPEIMTKSSGGLRKWFTQYWSNNVVGYDAWFWIRNDEGVDPDVGVLFSGRQVTDPLRSQLAKRGEIFLRVPLGGWFRRNTNGELVHVEAHDRMRPMYWWVRVRGPVIDPLVFSCIQIMDGNNERVSLTVSGALLFGNWLHENRYIGHIFWSSNVPVIIRLLRETRSTAVELRANLDMALAALEAAHDALLATKARRLDTAGGPVKSKTAAQIRHDLARAIFALLPEHDPRRTKYQPQQPKPVPTAAAK